MDSKRRVTWWLRLFAISIICLLMWSVVAPKSLDFFVTVTRIFNNETIGRVHPIVNGQVRLVPRSDTYDKRVKDLIHKIFSPKILEKNLVALVTHRKNRGNEGRVEQGFRSRHLGISIKKHKRYWHEAKTLLLLHEYGHILTLVGVSHSLDNACILARDRFFIRKFQKTFWGTCDSEPKKLLRQGHFLTKHASKNVREDVAETFVSFILCKRPSRRARAVAYRKIDFFYRYPKMIAERNRIRKNLGTKFLKKLSKGFGNGFCKPHYSS